VCSQLPLEHKLRERQAWIVAVIEPNSDAGRNMKLLLLPLACCTAICFVPRATKFSVRALVTAANSGSHVLPCILPESSAGAQAARNIRNGQLSLDFD
jgi:hypothetical protein